MVRWYLLLTLCIFLVPLACPAAPEMSWPPFVCEAFRTLLVELGDDLHVPEDLVLLLYEHRNVSLYFAPREHSRAALRKPCLSLETHLLADLDGSSTESGEHDAITSLHRDGDELAIPSWCTGADGDDYALGRGSRVGRRREEQAGGGFLRRR